VPGLASVGFSSRIPYRESPLWIGVLSPKEALRFSANVRDEYEVETGAKLDVLMVDYLGYYARGAAGNSPYERRRTPS